MNIKDTEVDNLCEKIYKIQKVILSCQTKEQLTNTFNWIKFIIKLEEIDKMKVYNKSGYGFFNCLITSLYGLLNYQIKKIKNKA